MAGAPALPVLREIVRKLRLVPTRHRRFHLDAAVARKLHGIEGDTLSRLVDLGLPHEPSGGELLFDWTDLANVALRLRLRSARYLVMRRWPAALRAADRGPRRYSVHFIPQCARPGHAGPCESRPSPSLTDILATAAGPKEAGTGQPGSYRLEVEVRSETVSLPAEIRQLLAKARRLSYFMVQPPLCYDLSFADRTGLADCELAARFLVHEGRRSGFTVRKSYGLFLAVPYSTNHSWAEFNIDGRWIALDPHLLNALVEWEITRPGELPDHRPLNGVLWRMADDIIPMFHEGSDETPVTFRTYPIDQ